MSLLATLRRKGGVIKQALYFLAIIVLGVSISACGSKNIRADSQGGQGMTITDIRYDTYSDKSQLTIKGSDILKYTVYKKKDPVMVNIEVYNADFGKNAAKGIKTISDNIVSELSISRPDRRNKVVLSVAMVKDVEYNVIPNKNELTIEFRNVIDNMLSLKKEEVKKSGDVPEMKPFEIIEPVSSKVQDDAFVPAAAVETTKVRTAALTNSDLRTDHYGSARIKTISVDDALGSLNITIAGDGRLDDFTTLELTQPTRLILDVWNAKNMIAENSIVVASNAVETIKISEHKNKVRFVFQSKNDKLPDYILASKDDNLVVAFNSEG